MNTQPKRFNGSKTGIPNDGENLRREQQSEVSPTTLRKRPGGQREVIAVILKMQSDLFDHGKRRALQCGALEPDEAVMQALEEHANAMARDAYRNVYDPANHIHDQLLDDEFRKCLKDRAEAEQVLKYAAASLREREEEAAQVRFSDPPPEQSQMLTTAAVIAVMVTVAPTLHDFVFVMADEFLSWTLSLISGLFLGLLITLMILGDVNSSGNRTSVNKIGLAAGILLGLALGALRIKEAGSPGDYIFAIAMTMLELGIVLGLEGVAMSRRTQLHEWASRKAASDLAEAKVESARAYFERCKENLSGLDQAIGGHIDYVEERASRFFHIEEIESNARKAVRDGFFQGVAENRGRVFGFGGKTL